MAAPQQDTVTPPPLEGVSYWVKNTFTNTFLAEWGGLPVSGTLVRSWKKQDPSPNLLWGYQAQDKTGWIGTIPSLLGVAFLTNVLDGFTSRATYSSRPQLVQLEYVRPNQYMVQCIRDGTWLTLDNAADGTQITFSERLTAPRALPDPKQVWTFIRKF